MRKGGRSYSITLRLLSTIVLGMLALSVLTLYSTQRLVEATQEEMLREYGSVQDIYAGEVARQMTQAQDQIGSIGASYLTEMAASADALGGARQYEALRCQVELYRYLGDMQFQLPVVTGYYIYGAGADSLVFQGSGYESGRWFGEQLRARSAPFAETRGWRLEDAPFGQLLISNTARKDLSYGAWVRLDGVWSALGLDAEAAGRFSIVPLGAPAPAERHLDAPLGDTGFLIRQLLPDAASTLPRSVRVLRLASYAMLLILPLSWLSLRRLVIRPLGELTRAIGEIDGGNTAYRIPEKSTSYEFDQLNRGFNRSMEAIARARSAAYETQLENERIRIRYLTQQMQPHFVLNTLNLIYSMEPEQYDMIQRTVLCLSRYYRYVARVGERLVPVEAELEHVRNYFQIQQIRYPDSFSFEISCPEELLGARIPPVSIQTFAENAVKHSLTVGEQNRVEVGASAEPDGRIHIRIRDSGGGYPAEVLDRIQTFRETRAPQEGLGLGIQNTIERLELIYGSDADLRFGNAPAGGAQVDIYLPIRCDAPEGGDFEGGSAA